MQWHFFHQPQAIENPQRQRWYSAMAEAFPGTKGFVQLRVVSGAIFIGGFVCREMPSVSTDPAAFSRWVSDFLCAQSDSFREQLVHLRERTLVSEALVYRLDTHWALAELMAMGWFATQAVVFSIRDLLVACIGPASELCGISGRCWKRDQHGHPSTWSSILCPRPSS